MSQLLALFNRPRITAWDVVDILVVSLLIYEALKLIRGTRAMQMAIGLVVVILLLYVSQAFPLRTMGWLIRNVLAYLAFAGIVLFQQDIRVFPHQPEVIGRVFERLLEQIAGLQVLAFAHERDNLVI